MVTVSRSARFRVLSRVDTRRCSSTEAELGLGGAVPMLEGDYMQKWREQVDECEWCSRTRLFAPDVADVVEHLREHHPGFLEDLRDQLTLAAAVERGMVQGG